MTNKKEIKEITSKKSFTESDWPCVADHIRKLYEDRKRDRQELEGIWDEVERQVDMIPDITHKLLPNGAPDTDRAWMPEMELPLQAQALEVLTADANTQMFPTDKSFYTVNADVSQSLFARYEQAEIIRGDDVVPLSDIAGRQEFDQEDVNLVVQSLMDTVHFHANFERVWDLVNAEAFSKGVGVLRVHMVKRKVFLDHAKGVFEMDMRLPCPVPYSIRDVYLDDRPHALMAEGIELGPNIVFRKYQRYTDLVIAAQKGSKDPDDYNGGWMPAQLEGIEGDKDDDTVLTLEFEGDLVTTRDSGESLYIPNCVITVVIGRGKKDKMEPRVVRFRWRKTPFSSYIVVPYHYDSVKSVYATSPLMKGMPIQKSATEALNRLLMAVAYNAHPAIQYDKDDPSFIQTDGPGILPGAKIGSQSPVVVLDIGNPAQLSAVYQMLLQQYADLTGMNPARFGSQTLSHTTAFAKDQEISRGAARTIDYIRNTMRGPMQQWLHICYHMVKEFFPSESLPCYMHKVKMFVNVSKDLLPERVHFDVVGADMSRESALRQQNMANALQTAVQLNTLQVQTGSGQPLNYGELIKEVLREGGFQDVERFTLPGAETVTQGSSAQPGMGQPAGPNAGNISTALQALAFGDGGQ